MNQKERVFYGSAKETNICMANMTIAIKNFYYTYLLDLAGNGLMVLYIDYNYENLHYQTYISFS